MTQIEQMYIEEANERLRQALKENTEKVTRKVTEEVTKEVTKEVTNDVTITAIRKMWSNGLEPDNISLYFDNVTIEDIEAIRATL